MDISKVSLISLSYRAKIILVISGESEKSIILNEVKVGWQIYQSKHR